MKSRKEQSINSKIISLLNSLQLSESLITGTKLLLEDEEIQAVQEYANTVSIVRLGFNDHGPVHMRIVALNTILMADLLRKAGIKMSLENEECGNFEDSLLAIIISSMLHDIGMGIGRQDHEIHSGYLSYPLINRILNEIYPGDIHRQVVIRSLALEGIKGHMGSRIIHSLEAGIVQVADGCDMTKGRARISIAISHTPRVGSIHQFSANSIEEVQIHAGQEKPIRLDVHMSSEIGLFQVEEVLLGKISTSTAKPFIELYAQVKDKELRRYL